jgi:thioredoxin reductase (NADPH)
MATAKLYGRPGSARGYAIREFLHRSDVPFEWHEIRTDEQARAFGLVHRYLADG